MATTTTKKAPAKMSAAEAAVRKYMTLIKDPKALIDQPAIDSMLEDLAVTDDPVSRLRLHTQIAEANTIDEDAITDAFIDNVGEFVKATPISAEAFAAEGVPLPVLRKAGLVKGKITGRRRASSGTKRVTQDEVTKWVNESAGLRFTVKEASEATGATQATVKKALAAHDGVVQDGTADHAGPGRAPALFTLRGK